MQAHSSSTAHLAQDSPTLGTAVLALPPPAAPDTYGQPFLSQWEETAAHFLTLGKASPEGEAGPSQSVGAATSHSSPKATPSSTGQTALNAQHVLSARLPFHVSSLNTQLPRALQINHLSKVLQKHLFKECKQSFNF